MTYFVQILTTLKADLLLEEFFMELFFALFCLGGLIVFVGGLFWLLFNLVKKRDFRKPGIVAVASLIVFVLSFVGFDYTYSNSDSVNDEGYVSSSLSDRTQDDNSSSDSSELSSESSSEKVKLSLNEEYKTSTFGIKITQANQNWNEHGQSLVDDTTIPSLSVSSQNGLQVTVDYTNYDMDSFLPSIFDFTVYDNDGKAGKIVNQQDGQDEVSKGRTGTTTFWVNLPKPYADTKYVEIEYANAVFKINLEH